MTEFLAWTLLFTVVASWLVIPWGQESIWKLFNVENDEELLRRFSANPRVVAAIGLVLMLDGVAVALSLIVLL